MEKISITRALSELNSLKDRYNMAVLTSNTIAVQHGSRLCSPLTHISKEDFEKQAVAEYQSTSDLFTRYLKIKTAIDESNAKTMITIGEETMTIQQALVRKSMLPMLDSRLMHMMDQYSGAQATFEKAVAQNKESVEKMIAANVGKDGNPEMQKNLRKETEEYVERSRAVTLVDPNKLAEKIKSLKEDLDTFRMNIDYALSESNSTTFIEIP